MLPSNHRLRTKDVSRLLWRAQTEKIVAYPFVYFVGKQRVPAPLQWGVQISNKFSKSSVKRHILKRCFYDAIQKNKVLSDVQQKWYYIMAIPHKKRQEDLTQHLATSSKTTIVSLIEQQYTLSLSSFSKKLWS